MAGELDDWIRGTVQKELRLALDWSKCAEQEKKQSGGSTHENRFLNHRYEALYEEDKKKSSLKVKLRHNIRERRAVQIIKV